MSDTTSTPRVGGLRERRTALGLTRLDLYVHPDDHVAVKALAARLQARRDKTAAKARKAAQVTTAPATP